jgi:hypothetical protein
MEDVVFQNDDVCILKPGTQRGIPIYHHSRNPNLCRNGMEKADWDNPPNARRKNKDYPKLHFFRAPFTSDTRSFEGLYSGNSIDDMVRSDTMYKSLCTILVDPDLTYVYSSDSRVNSEIGIDDFLASKITLRRYLEILVENEDIHKPYYTDLLTFRKRQVKETGEYEIGNERLNFPIEQNSEIVVKIQKIPIEWFVSCVSIARGGSKTRRKTKNKSAYKQGTRLLRRK